MEQSGPSNLRRTLPSIDRLLSEPRVARLVPLYGRDQLRVQAQKAVAELRERIDGAAPPAGPALEAALAALPQQIEERSEAAYGAPLRRVLNASGIFLHTNLGRAPLPASVAQRLPGIADAYCDLEIDLESGKRGERNRRVERLLLALTGAESAVVVNNNAAALVLVLAAHAHGREVAVSRGELVEIGGSFRIPEILASAGARLVEVGSTNRTRLADYERALSPATALLLKVFPSNFRQSGFVASVAPRELAELGRRRGIPVLVDEGSGLLRPRAVPQLARHPSFSELIADGCDLVCGSGDKLLGGPQAGILVGRASLLEPCRKHPLYRALRPDRMALAGLEGVLRLHLSGSELPLDRLWPDPDRHRARLERMAVPLGAEIVPAEAFLGGGSAPEEPIPGLALALPASDRLLQRLRLGDPPVVGYLRQGRLVLDLRTVASEDDEALLAAVRSAQSASVHSPDPPDPPRPNTPS